MNTFFVIFLTLFSVTLSLQVQDDNDFKNLATKRADLIKETPRSIRIGEVQGSFTPGKPSGVNGNIGARDPLKKKKKNGLDGQTRMKNNVNKGGPKNVQGRRVREAKRSGNSRSRGSGDKAGANRGNVKPGNGKPGNGKPGNGKPGNGKPGNGKPGKGKPINIPLRL